MNWSGWHMDTCSWKRMWEMSQGWSRLFYPCPATPISITVSPVIALRIWRSCLKYVDSSFCFLAWVPGQQWYWPAMDWENIEPCSPLAAGYIHVDTGKASFHRLRRSPTTQAALSRAALSRLLEWEPSQWTPTCTALAGTRHASSPSRALPAVNTWVQNCLAVGKFSSVA